jgi:hypothetical protein
VRKFKSLFSFAAIDMTNAIESKLYDYAKGIIRGELTTDNIIPIVAELMQFVDKVQGLDGPGKRRLVLSVVSRIIEEIPNVNHRSELLVILNSELLGSTIDLIVMASKKQLNINKNSFLSKICCCN